MHAAGALQSSFQSGQRVAASCQLQDADTAIHTKAAETARRTPEAAVKLPYPTWRPTRILQCAEWNWSVSM